MRRATHEREIPQVIRTLAAELEVRFGGATLAADPPALSAPAGGATLTFAPGETTKTITIQVNSDRKKEADETFFLNLSGALNAVLADSQGRGTIRNDD